jgi:hypothetical protein
MSKSQYQQGEQKMAWNVIREATEEDAQRLLATAERFAKNNGLDIDEINALAVESEIDYLIENDAYSSDGKRLRANWRRAVQRALKHPQATGIAYGYVGYSMD